MSRQSLTLTFDASPLLRQLELLELACQCGHTLVNLGDDAAELVRLEVDRRAGFAGALRRWPCGAVHSHGGRAGKTTQGNPDMNIAAEPRLPNACCSEAVEYLVRRPYESRARRVIGPAGLVTRDALLLALSDGRAWYADGPMSFCWGVGVFDAVTRHAFSVAPSQI